MTQTASDAQENRKPHDAPLDDDAEPQTNGHGGEDGTDGEPPSKKRRVSENPAISRRKPESPPWKKAIAEGPSSFTQDGIRKSGRTNHIPLELQPPSDKRQTRGAVQKTYSARSKNGNANHLPFNMREPPGTSVNGSKKPGSSGTTSSQQPVKSPSKPVSPKRSHRKSMPTEQASTPVRSHKRSSAPRDPQSAPSYTRPAKGRRSGRLGETNNDGEHDRAQSLKMEDPPGQSPKARLSRIKFRVKPAALPLTHPGLVLARPRQYPTLKEFLDGSANVHVDAGGLFHPDEASEYTPEQVAKDAKLILQAEAAAEPMGVLSREICSAFQPEESDQIPPQYAHQDHLNRAAIEFRRLMLIEARKHRATAKRLAEACRDEWYRRQPKTQEQLEAEEIKIGQNRYRILVKTVQATWENVRVEVNRRRILEWEAQEQARVRKALNEAVDMSTQMLQAQRAQLDSDTSSDAEGDEDEDIEETSAGDSGSSLDTESDDDRESNMSSTDAEVDEEQQQPGAGEDEHLTVEQLREKYASIPDVSIGILDEDTSDTDQSDTSEAEHAIEQEVRDAFDDSDESIDMDDDMGSSDEERGSDEEGSEEEDDEAGETSLLGFLAPSELRSVELGKVTPSHEPSDDEMADAEVEAENEDEDEVSLVPDAAPTYSNHDSAPDVPQLLSNPISASSSVPKQPPEVDGNSPDRSSQPTPRTTETKASEVDSASSVDLHQNSRQVTQSATPQPGTHLKTPVPFLLRGTLREYQHYGLDWLAGLYANNNNGILADEMGLGKTIQTIALLAHLATEHEVWGPHLVVVPTSVMLNWEIEFKKWCPGFKIMTYYGSPEERKRKRLGWRSDDKWNVCITTYQLIIADQQVFKRRQWHFMILDEAHNIKNFESQRWQVMLKFNTRARLLLTGTPLQNNLTELWSLLYFLMPEERQQEGVSGFASLQEFHDWFKKPSDQILEHGREKMDDEARNIISKLHRVLRPHLLRRLKADVEKQMPAKYEHVEYCRLSKRQRELYDGFLNRDDTRGTLASGNYLSIINCLMQLRKVCNHPDLFIERAIMTSFPMEKSAVADFEIKELLVRRRLLREDPMTKASLEFLNLVPAKHERFSGALTSRSAVLSAQRVLMDMREAQRLRAQNALTNLDPSTAKSNLVYLESASRWGRFEELQHCVYLNALRRQQKPLYGTQLLNFLTLGVDVRPHRPQPRRRDRLMTWLENKSPVLDDMVFTLSRRCQEQHPFVQKFACVTPPVVARDLTSFTLTPRGVTAVQNTVRTADPDPFHEARMRLSIQFPDKRLLQYDCGKLQTLDKLLRKLQAGGHRALIFTQMTKVLDILEQFLNIHGHKYLRLDGNTKVEQRQILTDRFNNDNRILAFILSTRSGGLGINLTGADTVIFYDLDWNPAMDKQCQDRCHRIGQTRDVHIYRLVSEHTIEANILRKANQKRMLDDVVIQEGEFTTDYFNKMSVQDVLGDESTLMDGDAAANAAMDRVLGGPNNDQDVSRVLAQAEDKEDVAAARVAEREIVQTDAADFDENIVTASATPAGPGTPRDGAPTPAVEGTPGLADDVTEVDEEDELNAWGVPVRSTDDYMLDFMIAQLKDTPVELPKDKSKSKNKKGKDHRSHRAR
ncbi:SNF2 family N-terminal domain containing protein [Hyaloscypha variabilis]